MEAQMCKGSNLAIEHRFFQISNFIIEYIEQLIKLTVYIE
jgi:hypothetical protein